jgi:hypothetical protein
MPAGDVPGISVAGESSLVRSVPQTPHWCQTGDRASKTHGAAARLQLLIRG